jgi:hypothetical protein
MDFKLGIENRRDKRKPLITSPRGREKYLL